uniref:Uncharacterized protein n=1 Tax=Arundo donax TaxID=35708 RepID=A0A0A9G5V4_ARUDO
MKDQNSSSKFCDHHICIRSWYRCNNVTSE